MDMQTAYKICELDDNGNPRALFHGTNGTRSFKTDEWLQAEIREHAKDGTSKHTYRSCFHTLPTLEEAQEYLSKFKTRLDRLVIYRCLVAECWEKKHSPSNVILSMFMKLESKPIQVGV